MPLNNIKISIQIDMWVSEHTTILFQTKAVDRPGEMLMHLAALGLTVHTLLPSHIYLEPQKVNFVGKRVSEDVIS